MATVELRAATVDDFDAIVALNAAVVEMTSAMDRARLALLAEQSQYLQVATVEGDVAGFLLAFRAGAGYDNANFSWFSERYTDFVYIDRIVVAAKYAGEGIGSRLYQHLFTWSESEGVPCACCEYNLEPPNPQSAAFHQRHRFHEVGVQVLGQPAKTVSMQRRELG